MNQALVTRVRAMLTGRQSGKMGLITITALTLLSKCFGFAREMLIAYFFGATALVDAFVVANNIYALTVGILGYSFTIAGTPLLVEKGIKKGLEDQRKTFLLFLNFCLFLSGVIALVLVIAAPWLTYILAPRFSHETHWLSTRLIWTMLPLAFGMVLLSLSSAYFNGTRRFGLGRVGDIGVNIVAISALFLAPVMGIYALGIGWSMGYFLAGITLAGVALWGLGWRPTRLWSPEIKEFLILTAPMLIAYAANQVNVVVDRAFASSLDPGSIAALGYGWRLVLVPMILPGALSTVHLTRASEMAASGNIRALKSSTLDLILKGALFAVPVSIALIWLARPLVWLVFQRGAFDAIATEKTSLALLCYGFGIFPNLAVLVLAAAFRGMKDVKTPVFAGVIAVAVNIALNFLLVRHFGIAGLATSTSAATAVNALIMGVLMWRR